MLLLDGTVGTAIKFVWYQVDRVIFWIKSHGGVCSHVEHACYVLCSEALLYISSWVKRHWNLYDFSYLNFKHLLSLILFKIYTFTGFFGLSIVIYHNKFVVLKFNNLYVIGVQRPILSFTTLVFFQYYVSNENKVIPKFYFHHIFYNVSILLFLTLLSDT